MILKYVQKPEICRRKAVDNFKLSICERLNNLGALKWRAVLWDIVLEMLEITSYQKIVKTKIESNYEGWGPSVTHVFKCDLEQWCYLHMTGVCVYFTERNKIAMSPLETRIPWRSPFMESERGWCVVSKLAHGYGVDGKQYGGMKD